MDHDKRHVQMLPDAVGQLSSAIPSFTRQEWALVKLHCPAGQQQVLQQLEGLALW